MAKCDYHRICGTRSVCYGIKNVEECSCGGDTCKCDFYPEKRSQKRLIDANALEFEPDENCIANGVLIWCGRTGGKTMTTVLAALKKMIANAPTVDAVEVVHGEWVQIGYDKAMDRITCSNCKEYWNICDNDTETFNYCPNCGAKMDGERKDND